MSFNPYAAPKVPIESVDHNACWSTGQSELYIARGSDLPPRCIKCNAPAVHPIGKKTLYWHASGWYLLILFNLLIYAIAALVVRKKIRVSPGLCPQHAKKRSAFLYGSLAVFVGALFLGIASATQDRGPLAALAFVAAFISLIVAVFGARTVYPVEIDERGARLKGCGKAFLDSLPIRNI